MPLGATFAQKTVLNAASWIIRQKRFEFDLVTCRHTYVNMADSCLAESGWISGSDYLEFEALMKGENDEKAYWPVGLVVTLM